MNKLVLKVSVSPGVHLCDAMADGCVLASTLRLSWVEFNFNDISVTCYPDGRSMLMRGCSIEEDWADFGRKVQRRHAANPSEWMWRDQYEAVLLKEQEARLRSANDPQPGTSTTFEKSGNA